MIRRPLRADRDAKTDAGARASERWASFDDTGANEQIARLRRERLPRRLRPARLLVAAIAAGAAAALALRGLAELSGAVEDFRTRRETGLVGAYIRWFHAEQATAMRLVETFALLLAAMASGAFAAGVFIRVHRGTRRALRALYGYPLLAGLASALTLLTATSLPYLVDAVWRDGRLEAPSLALYPLFALALLAAIYVGRRAARLAEPFDAPPPVAPLKDLGAPDRPTRAAICAGDPLARAAFERLLSVNGVQVVFASEYGDETRDFFRRKGRNADVLLLNDDVADMTLAKLTTHLADEAESAIGVVRLIGDASGKPLDSPTIDKPRGRIVAVEHVATPTPKGPLLAATMRAADAARAARDAATPLSEARGEENEALEA